MRSFAHVATSRDGEPATGEKIYRDELIIFYTPDIPLPFPGIFNLPGSAARSQAQAEWQAFPHIVAFHPVTHFSLSKVGIPDLEFFRSRFPILGICQKLVSNTWNLSEVGFPDLEFVRRWFPMLGICQKLCSHTWSLPVVRFPELEFVIIWVPKLRICQKLGSQTWNLSDAGFPDLKFVRS